mmetsp:Transcript_8486/g.12097  ORF Transcript_8486/g.12097 Transcript_8486/m.12097 type:complete len:258 (+) Transcript_8486:57-830(+)
MRRSLCFPFVLVASSVIQIGQLCLILWNHDVGAFSGPRVNYRSLNLKSSMHDGSSDGDLSEAPQIPKDMRYIEFNIQRQNRNFVAIREVGGVSLTHDLYCRAPENDCFYFVGKIARVSDVSLERAIARQWNLIEEHAARLRPLELYPKLGQLQLWSAPGDSELDVAYNRPTVTFVKASGPSHVDSLDSVKNSEVGFQGELYIDNEEGFRTWRNEDGSPKKAEIVESKGEKRAPTDEEMSQISEMMEGKDLNKYFEEQ